MDNKEKVSSDRMSQLLMGYWLLWEVIFTYIYSIVFSLLLDSTEFFIIKVIFAVIIQAIMAILLWKVSTHSVFKKKTIDYNDVSIVMKNLIKFIIIFCVVNGIYTISTVNSSMDESINSNFELRYTESMLSIFNNDELMEQYKIEKEKIIKDAKIKTNIYVAIYEVVLTATYLAVLPLEKKEILKYVKEE